jgi:hypothetical protein
MGPLDDAIAQGFARCCSSFSTELGMVEPPRQLILKLSQVAKAIRKFKSELFGKSVGWVRSGISPTAPVESLIRRLSDRILYVHDGQTFNFLGPYEVPTQASNSVREFKGWTRAADTKF